MVDFSYNILEWMKKHSILGFELIFKILKLYVNIFFPLAYRMRKPGRKKAESNDKQEPIVVSFTTFPPRIHTVWQTAYTLLNQSLKPDHVILWLADTQFTSVADLPVSLKRLIPYGLEIRFCDDLKPHKKYYYAMQKYPNAVVITVDDDIYYPSFLVEKLYRKHLQWPDAICCNWAHEITVNENGAIKPYEQWNKGVSGYDTLPSHKLNQVGYEGVLYPPGCLHQIVFDKELINTLCLETDDLWLKATAYLKGTQVIRVDSVAYRYFGILKSQKVALHHTNCGENRNDVAIKNIITHFKELSKFGGRAIGQ